MSYLIRGLALDERIRILACDSTDIVKEAAKLHKTNPVASIALGRVLTAASIMGAMLKGEEKLTIQINGNGSGGTLMADSDGNGNVKGFIANPNGEGNSVPEVVGDLGFLKVIKNVGMKNTFCGDVLLKTGEIGDDLSFYFYESEQIPSVVGLSVSLDDNGEVKVAGGYIIQLLPNSLDKDIDLIEEKVKEFSNLNKLLVENSIDNLIFKMFPDFVLLEKKNTKYFCDCSKEKFAAGIKLIDNEEIEDMIAVDHGCHIKCNFCQKEYKFNEEELQEIIDSKVN